MPLPVPISMIAWLVSVVVCIALLIRTSRYGIGAIVRRGTGAVIGAIVLLVVNALAASNST